jgi:hypothetical protein
VLLDEKAPGGGGHDQWCRACRQLIVAGQPVTHLAFQNDPQGLKGQYHLACSKPFASLARIVNLDPRIGL